MNYTNQKNKTIDGKGVVVKGPIVFLNCSDVVFKNWTINGGNTNLLLQNCVRCTVDNIICNNAAGPADPFGHGIQLNNCKNCVISHNKIIRCKTSEDGYNDYMGAGNQCLYNAITGHGASKSGNSITIDCKTKNAMISGNICNPQGGWGGIVIADGSGHSIVDNSINNCGTGITVCNYYKSKTTNVVLKGNTVVKFTDNIYWVDKSTTSNISVT